MHSLVFRHLFVFIETEKRYDVTKTVSRPEHHEYFSRWNLLTKTWITSNSFDMLNLPVMKCDSNRLSCFGTKSPLQKSR